MSSLKIGDLLSKYNIVSIDGDDIKLESTPTVKLSLGIPESRFKDYFDEVEKYCVKNNANIRSLVEPAELKRLRPFLLSGEAVVSKSGSKGNKGKKGKSKGKNSKSIAKIFTASNPLPAANRFISDNKPYRISQELNAGTIISTSTTIPTFGATSFSVNSLDQISQLAAVFDQYRIDEIECWCIPNQLGLNAGGAGLLYSVVDYDDSSNLSTIGQAEDYTNCLCSPSNEGHYRRFVPHAAVAMYSGSFTSYGNVASPWIDTASTNVQHYGLKMACTAITGGTAETIALQVRYHLSFRNVR